MIDFKPAGANDEGAIIDLLSKYNLPSEDIHVHLNHFIMASDRGKIIGCIAAELYGSDALLRSLAVDEAYRSRGVGKQLVNYLQGYAIESGVENLHLLTTTAESYFKKIGFVNADRNSAPEKIKSTKEFSALCPSEAVYMIKKSITQSNIISKQNYVTNLFTLKTN